MKSEDKKLHKLAEKKDGILRTGEMEKRGIPRDRLPGLVEQGVLIRESQGIYALSDDAPDEYRSLQARSEKLIFSYNTALYLLGLSDRIPVVFDVTVPQGTNVSRIKRTYPTTRFHYVQPDIWSLGITDITTPQGYRVKVYNKERTICDIIKNRKSIDTQIYTQAIKEFFSDRYSPRDLLKTAQRIGVEVQVRNYMEVM